MRTPEAIVGFRSSNGTVLRFTVSLHLVQALLGGLARPVGAAQVELEEVRVGAAGEDVEPAVDQRLAEHVRVRAHLALVVAERLRHRDLEAGRLRGDRVLERTALHPREDRAVDRLRVLLPAEDEAAARPGERLVRRRGDEVAVVDGVRVQPRGDEPGEVRHVAEEERADLVRDLAELPRLDGARIGAAAADDQLRAVLLRQLEDLVVVDDVRLARDAVVLRSSRGGREKLTLSPCVRWPPCESSSERIVSPGCSAAM